MKFGQTEILLFFVLLGEHSVESALTYGDGSCAVNACPDYPVTGKPGDGCWDNSCNFVGERNNPLTVIGTNSCTRTGSCSQVNRYGNSKVVIGNGSCIGDWGCREMGAQMDDSKLSLTIGDGSCMERESCTYLSRNARAVVTVGDDSCTGPNACTGWAKSVNNGELSADDEVYIGNSSCHGEAACRQVNSDAKLVSIGNNSCQGKFACSCLYNSKVKYVPDNTCNGKECCSSEESMTAFGSNLPLTKPPKIPKCDDDLYCESGSVVEETMQDCLDTNPDKCLEMGSGLIFSCDSGVAPLCFPDLDIAPCEGTWQCLDSDSKAIDKVVLAPPNCDDDTCLKTDSETYFTCGSENTPIGPTCIPPTLEDRFAINYGTTSFEEASGKYAFKSDFTFSNYINEGMVTYRLYDGPSCGDGADESTVQNSGAGYLESERTNTAAMKEGLATGWFDATNPRTATITSTVDPTQLIGSPIFDKNTAVIAWCVRIMASTTGTFAKEVNFNELVYTVNVDLEAGFQITNLSVEKRDADQASENLSYAVTACECDGSDCVTANEQRNQGDIVNVCVKPTPSATAAGVYMRSIKEFTWKRDDLDSVVSQPAIAANAESNNLLTSYSGCQGQSICVFTSILFADFYQKEGVVNGSGEAILQFGSSSGRKLRSLQEDDEVASIEDFDLSFAVNPTLEGANSSGSPAGSMMLSTLVVAAATWMMI